MALEASLEDQIPSKGGLFYLVGVKWVMPNTTMELLRSWKGIDNRGRKNSGGEQSQHAYGGLFGKKGTQATVDSDTIFSDDSNLCYSPCNKDHPNPEARCILGWPLCLTQVALSLPKLKLQQTLQLFYGLQLPPLPMTEEEEDFSDTLALMYSEVDPVPLQIDSRSHEESLAASATAWVQSNMVKLSQHFGVDLKGSKRETYTLLMTLDQRREEDKRLGENQMVINTSNMVLKEGSVDNILQSIWSNRWMGVTQKEAQGSSGGDTSSMGQKSLEWGVGVEWRAMYNGKELLVLKNSLNGPWIVCGDFNITRYPSERTNCHRLSGAMEEFSSCIEELQLVDPPLLGGSFTWRRGEDHSCASRIDRISHCAEWGDNFTHIKQSCLPKMASDHNPIILSYGGEEWKKSYFKFEIWWLEVEGFKDRVKEWWASFQVNGRPGYILAEKLKTLKVKLKEWSKVNRGNWKQRK
ncbi:hypothetical protein MTR67_007658 [Solanum verrucosum]|uniref:Uncharacterized protein n=1 Tax=Solanum verrucosum TaxID=315347 RepID=A0AAF0TFB3_SOLVR|nr:hypothetical protein MTR67_007658 [Solanum verrucosum]